MKTFLSVSLCIALLITSSAIAPALNAQEDAARENLTEPTKSRWKFGMTVKAVDGPARNIICAAPIPTEWPEQAIKIVEEDLSKHVKRLTYRKLDGATQMIISVSSLAQGDEAHAFLTFEVDKSQITTPAETDTLVIPKRLTGDLRGFIQPSPMIEVRDPKIEKLAEESLPADGSDWSKVEALYDKTRELVTYQEGEIKGALAALEDGRGDCEEMTSLFIALCRANKIPARTVWVPGHCYPEFYLEDAEGKGQWFPCQAAGSRSFGAMTEQKPILQKGDNFRLPGIKEPIRYARVTLQSTPGGAFTHPQVTPIIKAVPIEEE